MVGEVTLSFFGFLLFSSVSGRRERNDGSACGIVPEVVLGLMNFVTQNQGYDVGDNLNETDLVVRDGQFLRR